MTGKYKKGNVKRGEVMGRALLFTGLQTHLGFANKFERSRIELGSSPNGMGIPIFSMSSMVNEARIDPTVCGYV